MGVTKEGTITFWAKHPHADWFSNSHGYQFPTIKEGGLTVDAVKNPDRTFAVTVEGLLHGPIRFIHPAPPCDSRGLMTAITWTPNRVTLYLNGTEVQRFDIPVHYPTFRSFEGVV